MGDVAMTVPVLSSFTQQYPNVKITVLTRAFYAPMFSQLKNVTVFEVDVKGKHKAVLGIRKLYFDLKPLRIDAVADFHNVLRSNVLKFFFGFSGIPFIQIDKGRKEKKALTALVNKKFESLKTSFERYADVFRTLGFPMDLSEVNLPKREPLTNKVVDLVGSDVKKWIGIAPFAAFSGKMYPLSLMKEVIALLNIKSEYKILLFGGGETEKEKLNALQEEYGNCINITGQLSFAEELSLISNLDCMVAMDSGNAHLAAMYGINTITLWGVTHPHAGFYPFGQNPENALLSDRSQYPLIPTSIYGNKFPEGYEFVMNTIQPQSVYQKIVNVLS